jgi:hypothetical protein
MLTIGIGAGILVFGALALDEGELVTLSTEKGGRLYSTQLWIVEIDGREFVRANRPSARWLARLRANPAVGLRRSGAAHGAAEPYWAQPIDDPSVITHQTETLSPSATPPAPAEGAPGRGSGASS